jgi:hypothetical protein
MPRPQFRLRTIFALTFVVAVLCLVVPPIFRDRQCIDPIALAISGFLASGAIAAALGTTVG